MQIEIIIEVGTPYVYFHGKGFGQKSADNAQMLACANLPHCFLVCIAKNTSMTK